VQATLAARSTRANFWVRGLVEPSLLLAGGVAAWRLGGGLDGRVAAHVTAEALALGLAVVLALRILRREETRALWRAPALPRFARFSLPIAAGEMLNAVMQRTDIMVVTRLRGVEAAALYGAGELITRAVANIRYAFDSIIAGVLSETLQLGERERLRYNLRLSTRWVVSVAAPIAATLMVIRADLLRALFGPAYAAGAVTLVALSASQLVNAALGLTGWVLMVAGHSRLGLLNNLVGAAFNLPISYLLVTRYGVAGAACATLATSILVQGLVVLEAAWLQKVHPLGPALLKPLAAAALSAAAERAVEALAPPVVGRLPLVMLAGTLAYGAGLVALGLPREERQILGGAARVLRTRLGRRWGGGAKRRRR
jgi:O-antigen/teichoic acid export membrane protein